MVAVSGTELGLVLVHGFASGPKVWEPLIKLVEADPDLTFVGPMTFGYATGFVRLRPDRRIPSLDTVADSFTAYFDTEATAPEDLVIVGHSQGGLIIQRWLARMLAEGRGSDLARVKRVVLLACPNNGSQLGAGLRQRWLRRNEQEEQLRPLNEQITDTQRIVLRDIVNATQVTARTCPIPFSVYAGESDNVVVPASAQRVPECGGAARRPLLHRPSDQRPAPHLHHLAPAPPDPRPAATARRQQWGWGIRGWLGGARSVPGPCTWLAAGDAPQPGAW